MIQDAVKRVIWLGAPKPWLILGKGPSFDLRHHFNLDNYQVLTLNHACQVVAATLAHFTDIDVFRECLPDLITSDGVALPYVPDCVMPFIPYEHKGLCHFNLEELVAEDRPAGIRRLAQEGRLWGYNSSRVPMCRWHPTLNLVRIHYSSVVAAFNLLALAGMRRIFTLGVDGGTRYAPCFVERRERHSFDKQFQEITATVQRYGIDWINLAGRV